jgi:LmbE family N-acetylglucosaminyl deacetylase
MKLCIAPHNDDEALFCGFMVARHEPELLVVVFDSFTQKQDGCDWRSRRNETLRAVSILSPQTTVAFLHLPDDGKYQAGAIAGELRTMIALYSGGVTRFEVLIAPAFHEGGHEQHNLAAEACREIAADERLDFTSYTRAGGRFIGARFEPRPDEIARKLQALACYKSQIEHTSTRSWFTGGLDEYIIAAA